MLLHDGMSCANLTSMNLSTYLIERKLTQQMFAELVGCSQGRVSQLLAGNLPSLDLAQRIAAVTNGAVGVADWPRKVA